MAAFDELPPALVGRLARAIAPYLLAVARRQQVLERFAPADLLLQIDLTGPAGEFASHAVTRCWHYGTLPDGRSALQALLKAVAEDQGADKQEAFADLWAEVGYADTAAMNQRIAAYCRQVVRRSAELVARHIPQGGQRREITDAIFSDGDEEDDFPLVSEVKHPLLTLRGDHRASATGESSPVNDVRAQVGQLQRGVLLGEPGTGKTLTLNCVAHDLAQAWLAAYAESPEQVTALIPVGVPLRSFTGTRLYEGNAVPESFVAFVRRQFGSLRDFAGPLLAHDRVLLLCDALNEMPRHPTNSPDRMLVHDVRDFLQGQQHFVVSCRRHDYRHELDSLATPQHPLERVQLHEFTLPAIRDAFTTLLGQQVGEDLWRQADGTAELLDFYAAVCRHDREERFWESTASFNYYDWTKDREAASRYWTGRRQWNVMHSGARLLPLCRRPYNLALVCDLVAARAGSPPTASAVPPAPLLPTNRADLFRQIIDHLIEREAKSSLVTGRPWPATTAITTALMVVARAMQVQQVTTLSKAAVLAAITTEQAEGLLSAAVAANLLVVEEETELVRFAHHLLQEYFAVRVLRDAPQVGLAPTDLLGDSWWDWRVWRETLDLLQETWQQEGADGTEAQRLAHWLAPYSPELALQLLDPRGLPIDAALQQSVLQRALERRSETNPVGRATAYRVLGRFNADDRAGVGVRNGLPDIAWCRVPGGTLTLGGDAAAYEALPATRVTLPTFWIAQYPLTNVQFQAFVEAPDGYAEGRWWSGLERRQSLPATPRFPEGNHPRVEVDWDEAMACCEWLTAHRDQLGLPAAVPPDVVVRLPTEEEWEYAARWPDGRVYPYGAQFERLAGNTRETGIGRTSAVGIFAAGVAPCGALDLSGNVWEWTTSVYEERRGESPRVLRGGSWYVNSDVARAASRDWNDPGSWYDDLGFRVVVSSPIHYEQAIPASLSSVRAKRSGARRIFRDS